MILGLILLVSFARAEEPSSLRYSKPEVRKEIVAVIESQLAAFRAHDLGLAYSLAATGLRRQFTAQQFAVMIVRGYPVIAQNVRAEFALPMDDGSSAVVIVEVFAAAEHVSFRYALVKEPQGWRVAGVVENKTRPTDA